MKLDTSVLGSERVVLIDAGGREAYRGLSLPFPEGEKEELEYQGKLFVIHGESMGAKLFKETKATVIIPSVKAEESNPDALLKEAEELEKKEAALDASPDPLVTPPAP